MAKVELWLNKELTPVFIRKNFLNRCHLPWDTCITPELLGEHVIALEREAYPVNSVEKARKILLGDCPYEIVSAVYYFSDTDIGEPLDDFYIDDDEMLDMYADWVNSLHWYTPYTKEDIRNILREDKNKILDGRKRLNENREVK